tara:strand:+ start:660 stop:2588 length:1929 start_codon:yes stop_codon:yes gene_type:complete
MSIKILHLPSREDITNNTRKFTKTYTDGYIAPQGDVIETYQIEYVPQDGDTNITITFPPKQGTGDTFEILFEAEEQGNLNNQTIQLEDFTTGLPKTFNFDVRIAKSVVDRLDGDIKNHIFNRQILVNKASTELTFGLRFALDTNRISFETLEETQKEIAVQLFLDNEVGDSQLVPVDTIESTTPDTINLYRAVFVPRFEGQEPRSQAVRRGFGYDVNRPNSYIFEFNRISTAGDVDDNWDITFNKNGYLDGFGNELLGTTQRLNVTSGEILVPDNRYITRMFEGEQELNRFVDKNSGGTIDIPNLFLRTFFFDGTTVGARVADDDVLEYYIEVGASGVVPGSIEVLGATRIELSPESNLGTQRYGPIQPGEQLNIFGVMDSNVGKIDLTHYAILKETTENGNRVSSQLDAQMTTFNLTQDSDIIGDTTGTEDAESLTPEVEEIDLSLFDTQLITLNFSDVTLQDFAYVESNGSIISLDESDWLILNVGTNDPTYSGPYQTQLLTYRMRIDENDISPLIDGYLQFREVIHNPGETKQYGEWNYVPSNSGDYARRVSQGQSFDDLSRTLLTAETIANGNRYISIGLVPNNATFSEYEFRTVAAEDPETIRQPNDGSSFVLITADGYSSGEDPTIPTDPSIGIGV